MHPFRRLLILALCAVAGACANMPDATIGYYLPRATVDVELTRVLACGEAGRLAIVSSGSAAPRHMADPTAFHTLALAGLNGTFSDNDATFEFFEDGRLKSVNSTSTGRGQVVIEAALAVVASATENAVAPDPAAATDLCASIAAWNDGAPVTLRYAGTLQPGQRGQPLGGDNATRAFQLHAGEAGTQLGQVIASSALEPWRTELVTRGSAAESHAIAARPLAGLEVVITAPIPGQPPEIWTGKVVVPNTVEGALYFIPLHKPASFGKQQTAIAFAENGALTRLQYASEEGAAQVLAATQAAIDQARGPAPIEQAQAISDEVGLIVQQQRLATCLADPAECE